MKLDPERLESGTIVGNYEIIDKIGSGGHATIYRAKQLNLHRNVALKVISDHFQNHNEFVSLFIREARAMAPLDHPNIVKVYDAATLDNGISFFAMELIEGGNLQEILYEQNGLPFSQIMEIMIKIIDALAYGYKNFQLTHGDIKPANIMLDFAGEPKLADFGLAETIFLANTMDNDKIHATPLYVAPETISGQRNAGECYADMYSFACTFYHLITGEPPFYASDIKELIMQHLKLPPPPLKESKPEIPEGINDLFLSMMSKKIKERPRDWEEIAEKLKRVQAKMEHPIKYVIKQHWNYAFDYSEKEMIIFMFILSAILLLVQPWIGSVLLLFLTIAHYLLHSQKYNKDK